MTNVDIYSVKMKNEFQAATVTFFFLSGFYFTNIHELQDSRGRGRAFSFTPHYHFHPLQRHFDISQAITAETI